MDELTMTPAEMEAAFPELFKIARQLRARDQHAGREPGVRMHSIRIGDIDPDTGKGGQAVKLVQA